jgi:3,4-dihydroxy 2-butanone 4-phosphate synthase/GTP cyclohydrolase II
VADLIEYRLEHEPLVRQVAEASLPTPWATFTLRLFESAVDGDLHVALTLGALDAETPTLARVHRANLLGDALRVQRARGHAHLALALQRVAAEGRGAVVYLGVRDSAAELAETLRGYLLRERGGAYPTPEARAQKMDFKEFGLGAQILRALGLGALRVMTNSPRRLRGVSGFGLRVVEWLPLGDGSVSVAPGDAEAAHPR